MLAGPRRCSGEVLAEWFGAHARRLATLDPHAALDELEPLCEIVGDARVVAVGENAHFVEEFSLARARVLRFLAECCGFAVFALEFGFSEAFALDQWLQGGAGDEADLAAVSTAAVEWGAGELMQWLRGHNRTSGHPLRFVGIDLPEAGGALRPALEPVAAHMREVDLDSLPTLHTALEISDRFAAGSGPVAVPAWARLEAAEQDKLSAALARLLLSSDYRAVALTHTADHVPEMYPDVNSPVGFTLAEATFGHPPPSSVEAALGAAGLGDQISLTDLRHSPRDSDAVPLLNQIPTQSSVLHIPLPEAFDAVLSVPTVTKDRSVHF